MKYFHFLFTAKIQNKLSLSTFDFTLLTYIRQIKCCSWLTWRFPSSMRWSPEITNTHVCKSTQPLLKKLSFQIANCSTLLPNPMQMQAIWNGCRFIRQQLPPETQLLNDSCKLPASHCSSHCSCCYICTCGSFGIFVREQAKLTGIKNQKTQQSNQIKLWKNN